MRYNIFKIVLFASVLIISQACGENENEGKNEIKISSFNSTESHNMGQNCMECHIAGGDGEGWFTAAGTVYDSTRQSTYPNALIELYSGPNRTGSLISTIQGDAFGNFYTTENIDLGSGLYTVVTGIDNKHMNSSLTSGACNLCHGTTTDRIWTK